MLQVMSRPRYGFLHTVPHKDDIRISVQKGLTDSVCIPLSHRQSPPQVSNCVSSIGSSIVLSIVPSDVPQHCPQPCLYITLSLVKRAGKVGDLQMRFDSCALTLVLGVWIVTHTFPKGPSL